MTSRETDALVKADRDIVVHASTPVGTTQGWLVESGHGLMLTDTTGREIMDFAAGLTCVNLGYGRKELGEAAMAAMADLGYANTMGGMSSRLCVECAKKLREITPASIRHFAWGCNGSDAVDAAIKIARLYWRRKGRGKYQIISLQNAYHGVSMGVQQLTTIGGSSGSIGAEPLVPGCIHAPHYYCYRCPFGKKMKYPDCDTLCARYVETMIETEGEETVAAFIAEGHQGAGGQIPPPPTYWPMMREICTKHNVLLIDDEVMAGFGRTGKMFAAENWNLQPDIMCMAKGITNAHFPVAATGISDEIYNTLAEEPPTRMTAASFTYSGHPVGMAVAIKAMEIYKREKLCENATKVGKYLTDQLMQGFKDLPHVGDIHGLGLFKGMDLVVDKETKQPLSDEVANGIGRSNLEKGLLCRAYHARLGMTPALVVTKEQVDWALTVLRPVIAGIKV